MGGVAGITGAIKGETTFGEMALAVMFGWLPYKLIPEGEAIERGLKDEWDAAVTAQREGNPEAVNEFFKKYPEYKARLALFDSPEERLRWFMVDNIWENYYKLSDLDRKAAREQLGTQFQYAFIDKNTRDYFGVSLETMAGWANFFKSTVPNVVEPEQMPAFEKQPENLSYLYEMYYSERNAIAGGDFNALSDQYYALQPGAERNSFLAQHPELRAAWNYKDSFLDSFPFMEEYIVNQDKQYQVKNAWATIQELGGAADYLRQYYTGKELPTGVREYLYNYWKTHGRQMGSFEAWVYGMRYLFVP
jgi:hypothetical protein